MGYSKYSQAPSDQNGGNERQGCTQVQPAKSRTDALAYINKQIADTEQRLADLRAKREALNTVTITLPRPIAEYIRREVLARLTSEQAWVTHKAFGEALSR